ncbi:MAG: S-methyl-5-thioribose-1-phosphate isomerase [Deltaproteobacteria bacterium]|nr:S-methyl-5-thioribose-1-phosphate isomerase [Deltaproteobacteria bacterium]
MNDPINSFTPIEWRDGAVVMIDQRILPGVERWNEYRDVESVADAIRTMVIRGAPAIGVAAGYGVALAAHIAKGDAAAVVQKTRDACDFLVSTRPTAVNLAWAIRRMLVVLDNNATQDADTIRAALLEEARIIHSEDFGLCRSIGEHGVALVPDEATILTHCNAGALATAGHGTALGVIRSAAEAGKKVRVLADETRPFLQGARLTAWELARDGIDVTVISDVAAASLMARGMVNLVVVGTDRVAANGDVANKIGTYSVALAAHANNVPFYVAAPWSTIDLDTPTGAGIPIEDRPAREVTHVFDQRVVPEGVPVLNPAFDITPAKLVTALITNKGVVRAPYVSELKKLSSL